MFEVLFASNIFASLSNRVDNSMIYIVGRIVNFPRATYNEFTINM